MTPRPSKLSWESPTRACLKVRRKVSLGPLPLMLIFFAFWYYSLLRTVEVPENSTFWEAFLQSLRQAPLIIIFYLAPLLMLFMVLKGKRGLFGEKICFDTGQQKILRGKRALLTFDEIDYVAVMNPQKRAAKRSAVFLHSRRGGRWKIYRSSDYNELSMLANEVAAIVGAQVKVQS